MILWELSRATGIAAIALYTLSMFWGIVLSGRGAQQPAPALEAHRVLSGLGLLAVLVHVVTLLLNPHADIAIPALLGLGAGFGNALGAIALWIAIALPVSFWLRSRRVLSHRGWRVLHITAYPFWGLAVAHGLLVGTDTRDLAALALYGAAVALVAGATFWRIFRDPPPPRRRTAATR